MRLTVVCDKKIESSKSLRTVLIEKSEKKCQTVASYYSIFTHAVLYQIEKKREKKRDRGKTTVTKTKHMTTKIYFFSIYGTK